MIESSVLLCVVVLRLSLGVRFFCFSCCCFFSSLLFSFTVNKCARTVMVMVLYIHTHPSVHPNRFELIESLETFGLIVSLMMVSWYYKRKKYKEENEMKEMK